MNLQTIGKKGAVTALVTVATLTGMVGGSMLRVSQTSAQTTTATTQTTQQPSQPQNQAPAGQFDPTKGGHVGANGVKEVLLTGDTAEKVKAAALAAVSGGTIERVETDAEGLPYEAHMTKADGSQVTVKVDSNFKVSNVETDQSGPRSQPNQ